ncbi:MAG: NAD(P)H-dependent oxidoreductase subunit E [Defluviitaleaceae bacterium]|nr:NAD(P)H-dependent oxidoreductase subunit E [Defluviitaleaceae bacterium]
MAQTNEKALYAQLDEFIDGLPTLQGALITVLHKAQGIFGFLPVEVQNHVAKKLDIPASKVYGVVTFYSYFTMTKKGKYRVNICMGTACFVLGAGDILNEFAKEIGVQSGGTTEDELFSLDALRCVGACGLAPVVMVNEKVYGKVKKDDVKGIVDEFKAKGGVA